MAAISKPPKALKPPERQPDLIDQLPPDDPVRILVARMEQHGALVDKMELLLLQIHEAGSEAAAHQLLHEVPGAIDRMVLPRLYWKWASIHAAVFWVVLGVGFLCGYFEPSRHLIGMTCQEAADHSGVYCTGWLWRKAQ